MTQILILNVGKSNKGNCALVDSTTQTLTSFIPNVTFKFMGDEKIDSEGFNVTKIPGQISIKKPYYTLKSFTYLIQCFFLNIASRFNITIPISKKSPLYDYYTSDLILNSGGDTISGENILAPLTPLLNIYYGVLMNKPVVLYGESLGYFKSRMVNYVAQFVLNKTNLIIVREEISKDYLLNNNITKPYIYVTSDPAFILESADSSRISEILSIEDIPELRNPLIGINASGLISRYVQNGNQCADNKIADIMAKVIDELIENLGVNIILVPHVYTPNVDDRVANSNVFRKVQNKSNVYLIKNEYSAQELKGIIGLCDLFIGMRMHSTIASTSMLVPTIGIAYSHKMYGIIGGILDQNKYIIDIDNLNYDSLILKIYEAWKNKSDLKVELEQKVLIAKSKATSNGQLVKDFLDKIANSNF